MFEYDTYHNVSYIDEKFPHLQFLWKNLSFIPNSRNIDLTVKEREKTVKDIEQETKRTHIRYIKQIIFYHYKNNYHFTLIYSQDRFHCKEKKKFKYWLSFCLLFGARLSLRNLAIESVILILSLKWFTHENRYVHLNEPCTNDDMLDINTSIWVIYGIRVHTMKMDNFPY